MEKAEGKYGSGSGSMRCYVVEARCRCDRPQVLTSGEIMDGQWRQIHFPRGSAIGVRVQLWNRMAEAEGYLDFAAANALAWWFMANADYRSDGGMVLRALGVETRLVQVEFAYSFSAKESGIGAAMTEHDERDFKLQQRNAATAAPERSS